MKLPPQFIGKFSFEKAKEFWYALVCHILAGIANEMFGNVSAIRSTAIVLFLCGTFFLGKFLYNRNIPKWAWISVIIIYVACCTTAMAEYGYLPIFQLQGQLHGAELKSDGLETIVFLMEDRNKPFVKKHAVIDKDGLFHFSGLKKMRYMLDVYRHKGNSVEFQEFIIDLSDESIRNRVRSFNDTFSPETFKVKAYSICYFDSGISQLDSKAAQVIEKMVAKCPAGPYRILIEGNADETGGSERNFALSRDRANSAYQALDSEGASEKKAIVGFFGSEKPVALGGGSEALGKNRRVEIFFLMREDEPAK
jgi:outer membrane protein OmpA-like peptidoglycan-associated protein